MNPVKSEAQCPPSGLIHIHNQSELNAFVSAYGFCPNLPSGVSLKIEGVNNLSGLFFLESTSGDLYIENTSLTSMAGLNNLATAGAEFIIRNNANLTSLNGLQNLSAVGASFGIMNNDALTDLSALSGIFGLPSKLIIQSNDLLPHLTGLENLVTIGGDLGIVDNMSLTSLEGLKNLETVGGNFILEANTILPSLDGLCNLTSTNTSVVRNNPALTDCDLTYVCGHISGGGTPVIISGNGTGCESVAAVQTSCAAPSSSLCDFDADGIRDDNDNCPNHFNPGQEDFDGDGEGDACDLDDDNDGVADGNDTDPLNPSVCQDLDLDGCDDCSVGTDGFGPLPDFNTGNDGLDTDGDGTCDLGEDDIDGDGCPDVIDPNPTVVSPDTDNDGIVDDCDSDDDGDGINDTVEIACGSNPLNAASTCEICDGLDNDLDGMIDEGFTDTNGDGVADCVDTDDDGDGIDDDAEIVCGSNPLDAASTCEICDGIDNDLDGDIDEGFNDTNGDGQADCIDMDDDGDGIDDDAEITCGSNPLDAASTCEICDGLDNDLDGSIDEGFTDTNSDGEADCADSDDDGDGITDLDEIACGSDPLNLTSTCEVCDGIDNDLDGNIDEGFADFEGDGMADCVDPDDDNDGDPDLTDCDDFNNTTYTNAPELCDGVDNDCNGLTDDGLSIDADGDGHYAIGSCFTPADDCDDSNPNNFPGNLEVCDGQDNNCDGVVDEGYDLDGDGVTSCGGDCNDNDPARFPGNPEVCDMKDNDCNGLVDDGLSTDADGDGHYPIGSCATPADDCDDSDPAVYLGAPETCDGKDNDCDGQVDEGFDVDGDGVTTCGGDCDDNDPARFPGNPEICDMKDNDCNGLVDDGLSTDADSDGHYPPGSCMSPQDDCNDNDPAIYGGATEICDGKDNDCDGLTDEGFPDSDNDGIKDCVDACPLDPNNDSDGDGICGNVDICPNDPNNDADGDGICGDVDNCPNAANPSQTDTDCDGKGNVCDVCPGGDDSIDIAGAGPNMDQPDGIPDCSQGLILPFNAIYGPWKNPITMKVLIGHHPTANTCNTQSVNFSAIGTHVGNHAGDFLGPCKTCPPFSPEAQGQ
jgi:hypothetical protein